MSEASADWTTFHQHEALTTRLANILEEYPPGVSTLREYVQNADDAGASTLVLCLDAGAGSSGDKYPTPELTDFSGPALLVYNDATFSERDFDSISSVGKSKKREDTSSIGRYGLGFNVSYHFTDLVQFVSGETVVLFDPHGRSLPGKQLGMRARFTDGLGERYPSLLDPLLRPLARLAATAGADGRDAAAVTHVSYSQPVGGTLFRLPLRTPAQAAASELSPRSVSATDVRQLLCALCEANLGEMLLFTQSLTRVVSCVLEADGSLTHLGTASVDAPAGVSTERAALAGLARSLAATAAGVDPGGDSGDDTAQSDSGRYTGKGSWRSVPDVERPLLFELRLTVEVGAADGGAVGGDGVGIGGGARRHEHWLLCGGALRDEEASLLAAALGQPAAWASVALPLHAPVPGRAFCFLPLPLPSGLPIHVNGCFALTSNRRALWAEDADRQLGDQNDAHRRKARWNALLCARALPLLYAAGLEHLAAQLRAARGSGGGYGDGSGGGAEDGKEKQRPHPLLDRGVHVPLAQLLCELLPVGAEGAGVLWRDLQRATLRALHDRSSAVCVCYDGDAASAHDEGDGGQLHLAPLDGVVLAETALARGLTQRRLRGALKTQGKSLWAARAGAAEALEAAGLSTRRADAASVCAWLGAACAEAEAAAVTAAEGSALPSWWDRGLASELLSYVLAPHAAEVSGDGAEDEGELRVLMAATPLNGLRVVPLADGTLGPLYRAGRAGTSTAAANATAASRAAPAKGGKKAAAAAVAAAAGAAMGAAVPIPQFIIAGEEAAALLARCSALVDAPALSSPGFDRLVTLAEAGGFNLTPRLDASALLRKEIMDHLLAPGWHGKAVVSLRDASAGAAPGDGEIGAAGGVAGDEFAAAPAAPAASKGWQPKGKFGGGKKSKQAKPHPSAFLKGASSSSSNTVPTATSAVALDEAAVMARLRFLWRLVDAAAFGTPSGAASGGGGGDWGAAELARLEEWPTVPTADGTVLSIGRARARHVLRASSFADDAGARAAMRRFGVAFAALDSGFVSRRVCAGPERLGLALEAAYAERAGESGADAESSSYLSDCLALRGAILAFCVPEHLIDGAGAAPSVAAADEYMTDLEIFEETSGETSPVASPPRGNAGLKQGGLKQGGRSGDGKGVSGDGEPKPKLVQLSSAVVRRLPVFMTLSGRRCVALGRVHTGSASAVLGAPADAGQAQPYQPNASLDDDLRDSLGDDLLSYAEAEERTLLRLAECPRATTADLVRFLSNKLRTHTQPQQHMPMQLPVPPLLLLLSAAGGSKDVRLGSAERDELVRRLSEVALVVGPDGERRHAREFVDPTDELLAQAMRATDSMPARDDEGDGAANSGNKTGVLSMRHFPPAEYMQSAAVVAGLRACGMRSLDEPTTFLDVAEGVAAAARNMGDGGTGGGGSAVAVGKALLRLLLERWPKIGAAMSAPQLATLKRTAFVPCADVRHEALPPEEHISAPNPKLIARLETQAYALRNGGGGGGGGGGKKGKKGKGGGGSRGGGGGSGGSGGGDGGWSMLQDDLAASSDFLLSDVLEADAFEVASGEDGLGGGGGGSGGDPISHAKVSALVQLASWCGSLPTHRRAVLSREAGPLRPARSDGIVWCALGGGSTASGPDRQVSACLEADAWLCWTQCVVLPRAANHAPPHVLRALGIVHPPTAPVTARHLSLVSSEWRSRPAGWRDRLGLGVLQAFSQLCCAHAALRLRDEQLVTGNTASRLNVGSIPLEVRHPTIAAAASASSSAALAELSAQVGSRPETRRALASAPYIVADDGAMVLGRHVCVDLFSDLGPHARAVPTYLQPLQLFLVEVGGALTSSALAAPEVTVSAPNPFETLFVRMMSHVDDERYADVAFDFGGCSGTNDVVYAHKLILALSAPTFETMFGGAMAEAQSVSRTTIAMDPALFGADAFRLALTYIYTGELPFTSGFGNGVASAGGGGGDGHAREGQRVQPRVEPLRKDSEGVARVLELLLVADYLQHDHLKQTGERMLVDWEVLQVENVCDVYQHAVGASCAQLRSSCVQFIRGMFEVVSETEAWRRLDAHLQREVTELGK